MSPTKDNKRSSVSYSCYLSSAHEVQIKLLVDFEKRLARSTFKKSSSSNIFTEANSKVSDQNYNY